MTACIEPTDLTELSAISKVLASYYSLQREAEVIAQAVREIETRRANAAEVAKLIPPTKDDRERGHWIAHLEAHYSRYLAHDIRVNCVGAMETAEQIHSGNYKHVLNVTCEELLKSAEQARMVIETAYYIPIEQLFDFVRYATLPKWREAMEALGFEWDPENLRWNDNR